MTSSARNFSAQYRQAHAHFTASSTAERSVFPNSRVMSFASSFFSASRRSATFSIIRPRSQTTAPGILEMSASNSLRNLLIGERVKTLNALAGCRVSGCDRHPRSSLFLPYFFTQQPPVDATGAQEEGLRVQNPEQLMGTVYGRKRCTGTPPSLLNLVASRSPFGRAR